MQLITAFDVPESPARVRSPDRPPVRVGLVQHAWHEDPQALRASLAEGVGQAAEAGACIVFLPELTLSRYPADTLPTGVPSRAAEPLEDGPSVSFARELATTHATHVHISLYERADATDGLGFNTAVVVSPSGAIVARTRKMHIPVTAGYYEDKYFRGGPADAAYPVVSLAEPHVRLGLPTCWDEWFPEVARLYGLAGADLLCYPTAIGSEPDHPDFDTQPLWQQVIVGHAIANGLFIAVPNRYGTEGLITFYGSSFVVDPYGRILVQAPRDEAAVLVADLDLAQRRDWLELFPFFRTRRPDSYAALLSPVAREAGS
ncbi:MAG TPA: nitrilase-related carbon-nitrogen hydrolase [Dermatophilaceae bacterium]|nr:nitrilase-related carbon-nitrogen hydrolase [Dermatophilaceae bacterium]